jgi:hypothetical protein
MRSGLIAIAAAGIVAVALGAMAASGSSQPAAPGSQHLHFSIGFAQQAHATGGPFIDAVRAEQIALRIGKGAQQVAGADRTTVGAASLKLGFRAASNYTGDDREIWFVRVHGAYVPSFSPPGGQAPTFDHYYVVIDATTGQVLGTGSPKQQTW